MDRREFVKKAGAASSVPFLFNGVGLSTSAKPWFLSSINDDSDKVLIIIRLSGGNDGLNTLIPLDQYSRLYNARPNIIIPENNVLNLTDSIGLHPHMGGFRDLFEDGNLGIVQSVGYPNQNRSHFKSIQIWYSGSTEQMAARTGWLGRYLDTQHPNFPDNYPNSEYPDPFAISMGDFVSETCQGVRSNYSVALNDPFALGELDEWNGSDFAGTIYGEELTFLRDQVVQSNFFYERIQNAANNGNNLSSYPDTTMGQQLKNVALMIAGGLKTKIYTVNISGFDTHSQQVQIGNPTVGNHAQLLNTISEAVFAFQQDLVQLGLEDRVIGMTFSEFGRQIRSNGSFGTDHGTAAPLFLFGGCVNPGIIGDNPEIPEEVAVQEGVPMQFDFRNVYGSVLKDWFEVPESDIRYILSEDFQYLPVVSGCNTPVSSSQEPEALSLDMDCFPNPFRDWTTISFQSENERVRLSIIGMLGQEIKVLTDQRLSSGEHQIRFDGSSLPAGNYYFRLVMRGRQKTKLAVKVK